MADTTEPPGTGGRSLLMPEVKVGGASRTDGHCLEPMSPHTPVLRALSV